MAFTFFFRDWQTLEVAIDDALPGLQGRAFIHVWDAGCAHGPEPYTLAMLLRERTSEYVFRNVRIHATDVDSSFASQVTSGIFAETEIARVPPEIVRKHFRAASQAGFVEVMPELQAKVSFSHHDLLSLKPIRDGLSMIVCKNVLLHFEEAQRIQVIRMFHQALQPGGTLVMEHTQKLPGALSGAFEQVAPHVQVYRKVDGSLPRHHSTPAIPRPHRDRQADGSNHRSHPQGRETHRDHAKR